MKRVSVLALFCLLLGGCVSASLTNLTPRQQTRNANGLYPVEVMWDSQQATIDTNSIKGYVVVGEDAYPMQRSPMLPKRWETLLPVPADKDIVNYHFKFDYDIFKIMQKEPGSKLSAPYQIQITDR